jgi:hypothetical protein
MHEEYRSVVRLEERQAEQVFHGCCRQRFVLLDRQRWKPVPRLRCDDNARTAVFDYTAKHFEHQCGAVKINPENGGWDGETPAKAGDLAQSRRGLNQCTHILTRRHVDCRDGHIVARITKDFGRGVCILLPFVGEQHMFAEADTSRDGLANLPRADDVRIDSLFQAPDLRV